MVKNNNLSSLTLVAVVASLLAVMLGQQQQGAQSIEQTVIFPGLEQSAAKLEKILVGSQEQSTVVVEKADAGWQLKNKYNYPADKQKLRSFIEALIKAKNIEAKTAKAENYPRLGVENPASEGANSQLLQLATPEQQWSLIIGNAASNGGRYVRQPEQQQTWLSDLQIALPNTASDWLAKGIIDIEEAQIQRINLVNAQGDISLTAKKSDAEQTNFALANMPEGKKLKYEVILNSLATQFADLSLTDVQPVEQGFWTSLTPSHQVRVALFDGVEVEGEFRQDSEQNYWLKLSSVLANQAGQWNSWLYQVDEYSAKQFAKNLDNYIEDIE